MKDARLINATVASFVVFFVGIAIYGFAFQSLRMALTNDRVFAGITLAYFVLLRFGGRWIAKRLIAR